MHLLLVVQRRTKRRHCAAFMIPQTPPHGKAWQRPPRGNRRHRTGGGEIARSRYPVGRGLDPAAPVCPMVPFLGNVAKPGSALQDSVFSLARYSSFICGNTVSAPIHGPGSGAAIAEPTLCVGFACGKKPKKPPLIPRRGARPRANPVAL